MLAIFGRNVWTERKASGLSNDSRKWNITCNTKLFYGRSQCSERRRATESWEVPLKRASWMPRNSFRFYRKHDRGRSSSDRIQKECHGHRAPSVRIHKAFSRSRATSIRIQKVLGAAGSVQREVLVLTLFTTELKIPMWAPRRETGNRPCVKKREP